MTTPVTEICYLTLKESLAADIEDCETSAGRVLRDSLRMASEQKGFQRWYFGRQFENQDVLMVLMDWDSLEIKTLFTSSPSFPPFLQNLLSITTAIHFHHTQPTPFPPLQLLSKAPCIELATFFNCTPTFFSERLKVFTRAVEEEGVDGFRGAVIGKVVESVAVGGGDGDGEEGKGKGKAVTLWFGWDSKEAHMKFRDTKFFAENVKILMEGCDGLEMMHVQFKTGP